MLNTRKSVLNQRVAEFVGSAGMLPVHAGWPTSLLPMSAAVATPKLLIADDHALLRYGLRALLDHEAQGITFFESACLSDAIDTYRANPDIGLVLLDLNMNDCRGLQGIQRFMACFPHAQVAILSATQDEFVIKQAHALGAAAYIAKTGTPQSLAKQILGLLHAGDSAPSANDAVVEDSIMRSNGHGAMHVAGLGPRHLEILDHMLFGCTNQEICKATGLALGTVKNYVSTILRVFDVKSRSHLISVFR